MGSSHTVAARWMPISKSSNDLSLALGHCELDLKTMPVDAPNSHVAAVLLHECMREQGWKLEVIKEITVY